MQSWKQFKQKRKLRRKLHLFNQLRGWFALIIVMTFVMPTPFAVLVAEGMILEVNPSVKVNPMVEVKPMAFSLNGDGYMDEVSVQLTTSPLMEKVLIFLYSHEVKDYVGFIGQFNQAHLAEMNSFIGQWDGHYYPMYENRRIGAEHIPANEGYYTIDFYTFDEAGGKLVARSDDFFIDITKPEVTLSLQPGTNKIPAGQSYTLSGQVRDINLQIYKDAGYDVTEALNIVFIYNLENREMTILALDAEGNFNHTFTLKEGEQVNWLLGVEDFAGNMVDSYYQFVGVPAGGNGEGKNEGEVKPDIMIQLPQENGVAKLEYGLGETIHFDITAQDLVNLFTSQYTLAYDPDMLELVSMDVHSSVQQFAAESNRASQYFTYNKDGHPTTHPNHKLSTGIFTLLGQGAAIIGDMPLYQVEMRVTDDKAHLGKETELFIHEASYVNMQAGMVEILAPEAASKEAGSLITIRLSRGDSSGGGGNEDSGGNEGGGSVGGGSGGSSGQPRPHKPKEEASSEACPLHRFPWLAWELDNNNTYGGEVQAWAEEAVNFFYQHELLQAGAGLQLVHPFAFNEGIQRLEVGHWSSHFLPLDKRNEIDAAVTLPYLDLTEEEASKVQAVITAGWMIGERVGEENYFRPAQGLTRAQLATLMQRIWHELEQEGLKWTLPTEEIARTTLTFEDTTDHWAEESIQQMVGMGLMKGYSSKEFAPDQPLTRAEYLTIWYRLLTGVQCLGMDAEKK